MTPPTSAADTPPPTFPRLVAGDKVSCYFNESIKSLGDGDWVTAQLGYVDGFTGMLTATATTIGTNEQFAICYDFVQDFWYFVSNGNNLIVSNEIADPGYDYGMLRARAGAAYQWEEFSLYCTSADSLVINSNANSNWISTELDYPGGEYAMLRARATAIGPWEQYNTLTRRGGC